MWRHKNGEDHPVEQANGQSVDVGCIPVECLQWFVANGNAELFIGVDMTVPHQRGVQRV